MDPVSDLEKIDRLVTQLQNEADKKKYLKDVDAWWTNFKTYLAEAKNVSDWKAILTSHAEDSIFDGEDYSFEFLLSQFLFSRQAS